MNSVKTSKTFFAKAQEIRKQWVLINADNKILGRLATQITKILRGKHKSYYTPNVNCGDNVIVINVDKIHLTGKKFSQKIYYKHTGFPGGIKKVKVSELLLSKQPEKVLKLAVKRMMPKESSLAKMQLGCLYAYGGNFHPHSAQNPTPIKL